MSWISYLLLLAASGVVLLLFLGIVTRADREDWKREGDGDGVR